MKSYLIVEEHNTKTLKIIPYSEYLLNADNVFLYEVISDADTEDEADLIRNHINEVGGIQEYFNEIAREAKKEVEKNKEDIQEEELEQLRSSETSSISPAVIPENYLDRAILKKFRYELDVFEDYLGMIRYFMTENDPLSYIRLNDDSREEKYVYFKDVERQLKALKIGVIKLYYYSFHKELFDDFSQRMDEMHETEQLILSYPLYKLKQALYKEEEARDIFAQYSDRQIRNAIKNYDNPKYQREREECAQKDNNKVVHSVSFDIDVHDDQISEQEIKEYIMRGLRYWGIDTLGKIKIEEN